MKSLREVCGWARKRTRIDADAVIMITGDERKGKSTLAFILAHLCDPNFSLDQIVFRGRDHIKASEENGRGAVIWLDEAISGAFSRDAMKKDNKELFKYLTICGEKNQIHLVLWPKKSFMERGIKDHRAHLWFHVERRGVATLAWPKRGKHHVETWWEDIATIRFPKISGPRWEAYIERKSQFVQEVGRGSDVEAVVDPAEAALPPGWELAREWAVALRPKVAGLEAG